MTIIKSIVVCLALANVGYFLWAHGIDKRQEAPAAIPAATLRLASEAGEATPAAAAGGSGIVGSGSSDGPDSNPANFPGTTGPAVNAKRCVTVGPFRDVSEAAHAASTLRGVGYDPRQRVVEGEVWAGVWVYLPIPTSRANSEQVLARLKGAGIDDALEMPGPTEGSVISLGLFSEQKRAQARVAQTQALGLNPAVADRKRTGNVYWIDIDLKPTDGSVNPSDLQADAGHISRLEVKACPPDAAATPVPGQQPSVQGQP